MKKLPAPTLWKCFQCYGVRPRSCFAVIYQHRSSKQLGRAWCTACIVNNHPSGFCFYGGKGNTRGSCSCETMPAVSGVPILFLPHVPRICARALQYRGALRRSRCRLSRHGHIRIENTDVVLCLQVDQAAGRPFWVVRTFEQAFWIPCKAENLTETQRRNSADPVKGYQVYAGPCPQAILIKGNQIIWSMPFPAHEALDSCLIGSKKRASC